jgi:hypothetical protein
MSPLYALIHALFWLPKQLSPPEHKEGVVANSRFAVHGIRNIIVRMRLGESDRQLAKTGLIGHIKAAKIRSLADENGWLDKSVELPANLEIESAVLKPCLQQTSGSLVKPYATNQVKKWIEEGITATVILCNPVIRRAALSEDKEAEQAVPSEIMYIIYDKFPCGDQYQ